MAHYLNDEQRVRIRRYVGHAALAGEWPTWLLTVAVYGGWLLALAGGSAGAAARAMAMSGTPGGTSDRSVI